MLKSATVLLLNAKLDNAGTVSLWGNLPTCDKNWYPSDIVDISSDNGVTLIVSFHRTGPSITRKRRKLIKISSHADTYKTDFISLLFLFYCSSSLRSDTKHLWTHFKIMYILSGSIMFSWKTKRNLTVRRCDCFHKLWPTARFSFQFFHFSICK